MTMQRIGQFLKLLGPGLLFAGAAIGVSHLIQSTRAGAVFGFGLVWAVVLVNLMKFPFFEFGPRYTMATGETLLKGYQRLGNWVLWLFLIVSLLTVFTIQATVTQVTAGIAQHIMPMGEGVMSWSILLLAVCFAILYIGRYSLLDRLMKLIVIILSISTLIALFAAFSVNPIRPQLDFSGFDWQSAGQVAFLIGLMGWMPAPIDLSVWHSLWTKEKQQLEGNISMKQSLLDFNIGYVGAAFLALCFLTLGALMIFYGEEQDLPTGAVAFSNRLIDMYTGSLGVWSKWVISFAALTTMFSTTLTCFDAIPRVFSKTIILLRETKGDPITEDKLYKRLMIILVIGTILMIAWFSNAMLSLVQLATILSFLTAPFFAIANYRLVTGKFMPAEHRPGWMLKGLSWLGFLFLIGFGLFYLYSLMGGLDH